MSRRRGRGWRVRRIVGCRVGHRSRSRGNRRVRLGGDVPRVRDVVILLDRWRRAVLQSLPWCGSRVGGGIGKGSGRTGWKMGSRRG